MIGKGIATYLEAQGVGSIWDPDTNPNGDIFVSVFQDTPNNAFCIFDEAGPVLPEMSSYDANNFGVNIIVRGSFSYCFTTIIALLRNLPMLSGTYDDIRIIDTSIQSMPQFIEVDDKGRRRYSVHFLSYCNIGGNVNRQGNYNP
jgi:hypothetical protein